MRVIEILALTVLFPAATWASCPDFSGHFNYCPMFGTNKRLLVEQHGCDKIKIANENGIIEVDATVGQTYVYQEYCDKYETSFTFSGNSLVRTVIHTFYARKNCYIRGGTTRSQDRYNLLRSNEIIQHSYDGVAPDRAYYKDGTAPCQ